MTLFHRFMKYWHPRRDVLRLLWCWITHVFGTTARMVGHLVGVWYFWNGCFFSHLQVTGTFNFQWALSPWWCFISKELGCMQLPCLKIKNRWPFGHGMEILSNTCRTYIRQIQILHNDIYLRCQMSLLEAAWSCVIWLNCDTFVWLWHNIENIWWYFIHGHRMPIN